MGIRLLSLYPCGPHRSHRRFLLIYIKADRGHGQSFCICRTMMHSLEQTF